MHTCACSQARVSPKGFDRTWVYQGTVACTHIRPVFVSVLIASRLLPVTHHRSVQGNLSRSAKKYLVNSTSTRGVVLRARRESCLGGLFKSSSTFTPSHSRLQAVHCISCAMQFVTDISDHVSVDECIRMLPSQSEFPCEVGASPECY